MYSPVDGFTRTRSPTETNSGTFTVTPFSSLAGFVDAVDGAAPADPGAGANRWNLTAYAHAPKLAPQAADPDAEQRALAEQADRVSRLNRSRLALLQAARI